MTDDFRGDTPHLIRCIEALLSMDADGALAPHGVGGHARALLSASAVRLAALSAGQAQPVAIKPLEWEYVERRTMTYTAFWADGDVAYYIDQSFGSDSYYFRTIRWPEETIYDGDDLPSAKAAAQSDYEARIRSALVPPEDDESRVRDLEERLAKAAEALEQIADLTARCEHDGGFDREIGPIGCNLGDKCLCIGLHPIARTALSQIRSEK